MMRNAIAAIVVGVVVVGSGCSWNEGTPTRGGGDDGPTEPVEPGVDAAVPPQELPVQDPGANGPWKAGVRTVQLTDPARNRKMSVDIWYPVDPGTTDGTANEYKLESLVGTLASMGSPARRNATPAIAPAGLAGASSSGWPLVVFSHGYGGIRFQSYFATERLATHGFVVVAPDHPGNTLLDIAQLGNDGAAAQSAIDRPLDVMFVIDHAIAGTLGVNVAVDPSRIGITGHSFGGWTALEVMRRDPRVDIAFPMAPGFRNGATDDFVATLARPLLLIGGSADGTCEFPANQQDPYDKAQLPKYLLEVMNAGHLDFSNLCEVPIAKQFIDDGCDPAKIDPAVVHARVNVVATAFALRYLRGDARYDVYLADPAVAALGNVMYWSAK